MRDCPIPNAEGWCEPEGTGANGVMILGEAMGEQEAEVNLPFRPYAPAGSVLERAIRRIGTDRQSYVVWNVVPVRPPKNWLEGAPWEHPAVEWGRHFLEEKIAQYKPKVIVALGNIPLRATTGLAGKKLGVSNLSGFLLPSLYNIPVIPCFHPSYMRRGKMSHFGLLLRSLKMALVAAREGRQPVSPPMDNPPEGYIMYPTEDAIQHFESQVKTGHFDWLTYDIETPYSNNEDEASEVEEEQPIKSIQFSVAPGSGIFLPWRPPFIDYARRILAHPNIKKASWNGWKFDEPKLAAHSCHVIGENHDLMWAWHHLHPDIPRGLQFAAAQLGWKWPWKHLDASNPQFYGIVDVDVLQWMIHS